MICQLPTEFQLNMEVGTKQRPPTIKMLEHWAILVSEKGSGLKTNEGRGWRDGPANKIPACTLKEDWNSASSPHIVLLTMTFKYSSKESHVFSRFFR